MTAGDTWVNTILDTATPAEAWTAMFGRLRDLAITATSPVELHNRTVAPDRLLAESAWELWAAYPTAARRTSQALIEWWTASAGGAGRAVLVIDALSLRELSPLLGGAHARGIKPTAVAVTGAEVPSDTDHFAQALGCPSRGSLKNNAAPGRFALAGCTYTNVLDYPFEDCVGSIPNESSVFVWHTWLDDLIHLYPKLPDQVYKLAAAGFQGDGFWALVNRLRQGRRLVITADHGYAVSKLFTTEEKETVVDALRQTFGATRRAPANEPWEHSFMPPIVLTVNDHHVVMGQRKWKAPGGFPQIDHGGLTLLEVAVPFVELPAI